MDERLSRTIKQLSKTLQTLTATNAALVSLLLKKKIINVKEFDDLLAYKLECLRDKRWIDEVLEEIDEEMGKDGS